MTILANSIPADVVIINRVPASFIIQVQANLSIDGKNPMETGSFSVVASEGSENQPQTIPLSKYAVGHGRQPGLTLPQVETHKARMDVILTIDGRQHFVGESSDVPSLINWIPVNGKWRTTLIPRLETATIAGFPCAINAVYIPGFSFANTYSTKPSFKVSAAWMISIAPCRGIPCSSDFIV